MLLITNNIPCIIQDDIKMIIDSFVKSAYIKNIKKIILFGSFAKQRYQPDSDIDIAVILQELPPPHLKIEYYSLVDIAHEVDILFCTEENLQSGKYVYKNILREGVTIFENI